MTYGTDDLNGIMEFDAVVRVEQDGTVSEVSGVYAPEVIVFLDSDGQITDEAEKFMVKSVEQQGWKLLSGYTGQYSCSGPIMHPSEFVGGRLAEDILEQPGLYVVCEVRGDTDTDDLIGWVVAHREEA